jgi:hypothetical protein
MKEIVPPPSVPVARPEPSLSPWPTNKQVRQFTKLLDDLVYHHRMMTAVIESLESNPRQDLTGPKGIIKAYQNSPARKTFLSEDYKKLEQACSPEDWWDDSNEVQESEVARMLGSKLLNAFPTSNIPDPKGFTEQMIEDVCSWRPDFLSLETACKELRLNKRFMPAISEVREAYEAASKQWAERWDADEYVEGVFEDLVKLVERVEKHGSIWLDDRVMHAEFGPGKVDYAEGPFFRVLFDSDDRQMFKANELFKAKALTKLKPGDAGFEIAPEVVARREEERKAAEEAEEARKAAREAAKRPPWAR